MDLEDRARERIKREAAAAQDRARASRPPALQPFDDCVAVAQRQIAKDARQQTLYEVTGTQVIGLFRKTEQTTVAASTKGWVFVYESTSGARSSRALTTDGWMYEGTRRESGKQWSGLPSSGGFVLGSRIEIELIAKDCAEAFLAQIIRAEEAGRP